MVVGPAGQVHHSTPHLFQRRTPLWATAEQQQTVSRNRRSLRRSLVITGFGDAFASACATGELEIALPAPTFFEASIPLLLPVGFPGATGWPGPAFPACLILRRAYRRERGQCHAGLPCGHGSCGDGRLGSPGAQARRACRQHDKAHACKTARGAGRLALQQRNAFDQRMLRSGPIAAQRQYADHDWDFSRALA